MEIKEKVALLAEGGKYDVCSCSCTQSPPVPSPVYRSFTPDGRYVSLFRVLMSNKCSGDCSYCPNSCERRIPRAELSKEEYVKVFLHFYNSRFVNGLFLSSGILKDPDSTTERMVEIAEHLRFREGYKDYIHLKILPGASYDIIRRAAQIADRLSINIEVPRGDYLEGLCSTKDYRNDIIRRMGWLADMEKRGIGMRAGQTTQFVVGASGENDHEILECMEDLYASFSLRRCYFSAYIPMAKSPYPYLPPPLKREHRLYQTDFLIRRYGFTLKDISFDDKDNLPLRHDPKFIFALRRKELFPMDVNDAPVCDLVKVPGIGPTSARRIAAARKSGFRFSKMAELKNVGVVTRKACGFLDIGRKIQTRLCHDV